MSSTCRPRATRPRGFRSFPGSSIKGVLRDARRAVDQEKTEAVFGPSDGPAARAGSLVVGDARLLALAVRSFRGARMAPDEVLDFTLARDEVHQLGGKAPSGRGRCRIGIA